MKSGNPEKAYWRWRQGQKGLTLLTKVIDRVVEALATGKEPKETDLRLIGSGILHLKLSASRELREDMKAELVARRERLELHDLELAAKLRKVDNELLLRAIEAAASAENKLN